MTSLVAPLWGVFRPAVVRFADCRNLRRQLMEAWSAYCSSSPAKLEASVVRLRA
jgi:hypothetical protein